VISLVPGRSEHAGSNCQVRSGLTTQMIPVQSVFTTSCNTGSYCHTEGKHSCAVALMARPANWGVRGAIEMFTP
jgi:hypothetical protein